VLVLERVWRFESSSGHHSIFDLSQIKYLSEKKQHIADRQTPGSMLLFSSFSSSEKLKTSDFRFHRKACCHVRMMQKVPCQG